MHKFGFILIIATAVLLNGCSSIPVDGKEPLISTQALLSGSILLGPDAENLTLPEVDILELDDEMRQFVKNTLPVFGNNHFRSKRLIAALLNRGLLDLDYDPSKTFTAAETFHSRAGNCLSFTNLFVALAREAGIKVRFQQVDIPPIWSQRDDFIILNNHINVKLESRVGPNYEVDFNQVDFKGNYDSWLVSDESAFSQYYNNLGVSFLQKRDNLNAFRYLKKAISLDSRLSENWTNLGVLYSQNKLYEYAEAAYLHAIQIDHRAKLAISNLVKLYDHLGEKDKADYYRTRIVRFRNSNPYYHYWLAKRAYKEKKYQESIDSLKRAIYRKHNEHLFYFLLGANYLQTDKTDKAKFYFNKAVEYSNKKTKGVYLSKIEQLMERES